MNRLSTEEDETQFKKQLLNVLHEIYGIISYQPSIPLAHKEDLAAAITKLMDVCSAAEK